MEATTHASIQRMMPAMKTLAIPLILAIWVVPAAAGPKKYHFELATLTAKPEVKADVAKTATARVEAQLKKAMATSDRLVADLDGAPARDASADAWRRYLAKKGVSGAFHLTVELTEASEKLEASDKPNTQRLVVHVAIHMLGETIPGRTMGFTGDGQATVKQEVDMKVRDRDREYSWDGAAETAVAMALKECFAKLEKPAKKP
jgi:hypothetical protein